MIGIVARRVISTVLALLISAVALRWLLADGTGPALLDALRAASLWPLALGSVIAIAIQIVRAWRFSILTNGSQAPPSWIMIGIATRLVLLNFALPFKLGELGFPVMMKRAYGMSFARGAGILMLCRLLDFGVVSAIILLTAAWLLDPAGYGWSPGLLVILGLIALLAPLVIADRLPWLQRLTISWPRVAGLTGQVAAGAAAMQPWRRRLSVSLLTLAIWIGHALIAWLTAIAIVAEPGFIAMAMASAASNLAFALPISGVAGLGPPQAAWATMLHLAGEAWAPAITTALLCHGVLLITTTVFGALLWLIESVYAPPARATPDLEATAMGRPSADREPNRRAP